MYRMCECKILVAPAKLSAFESYRQGFYLTERCLIWETIVTCVTAPCLALFLKPET